MHWRCDRARARPRLGDLRGADARPADRGARPHDRRRRHADAVRPADPAHDARRADHGDRLHAGVPRRRRIALIGFVVSWWLPEHPLRATAATSQGLEDSLAAPRGPDSLAELERAITRCTTTEERERFHGGVAERAGVELSPGATWALVRVDEHGFAGARELAARQGVPPERVAGVVAELRGRAR